MLCVYCWAYRHAIWLRNWVTDRSQSRRQILRWVFRADLVRRRPDVRQSERLVAAQCAQIGVAESELYPHFAINGVLQWQSEQSSDLLTPASSGGAVGPSFVWNILNYGRIQNSVLQQQALFEQTVYSYQNTVLNAQREAEDAIVGFLKAQDQTAQLQLAVRDIKELDGVFLTQANAGATNFDRVFVVQAQATVQEDNLATSTGNIALNLIRIYRSLGGGWQIRCQPPCAAIASVQAPLFQEPAPIYLCRPKYRRTLHLRSMQRRA